MRLEGEVEKRHKKEGPLVQGTITVWEVRMRELAADKSTTRQLRTPVLLSTAVVSRSWTSWCTCPGMQAIWRYDFVLLEVAHSHYGHLGAAL